MSISLFKHYKILNIKYDGLINCYYIEINIALIVIPNNSSILGETLNRWIIHKYLQQLNSVN